MAQRLRLYDIRNSRIPANLGLCVGDQLEIAAYVNSAQQRLLYCKEAGNDGWWGTYAEVAFTVNRDDPYLTLPRNMARVIAANWCDEYVPVQNQWYEYLQFGNGRMPKTFVTNCFQEKQMLMRNNVVTSTDLSSPPQLIRVYVTESSDVGKRVVIGGLDNNNVRIYSQDGLNRVDGIYLVLDSPFVTSAYQFNQILSIQKDVTDGEVKFYQVDPTTGDEVLLLTMEPGEQTAWYRRYYLSNLPSSCCPPPNDNGDVTLTAIVKLELLPVRYDTDYLLIQNLEAINAECQSIRFSEMDQPQSKQSAAERHQQAVRLLNGEIQHYLGSEQIAVGFKPFGSASLRRQQIGTMI